VHIHGFMDCATVHSMHRVKELWNWMNSTWMYIKPDFMCSTHNNSQVLIHIAHSKIQFTSKVSQYTLLL
jgi:hypothetical protein